MVGAGTDTLERAVVDAPDDAAAWSVLGDHLLEDGDPLGEGSRVQTPRPPARCSGGSSRRSRRSSRAACWWSSGRHGVPYRACVDGEHANDPREPLAALAAFCALPATRLVREIGLRRQRRHAGGARNHRDRDLRRRDPRARCDVHRATAGLWLATVGRGRGGGTRAQLAPAAPRAGRSRRPCDRRRRRTCAGSGRGSASRGEHHLAGNAVRGEGAAALAASTSAGRLRLLKLHDNQLGDDGMVTLAAVGERATLRSLLLGLNRITGAGVRALCGSRLLRSLEESGCR